MTKVWMLMRMRSYLSSIVVRVRCPTHIRSGRCVIWYRRIIILEVLYYHLVSNYKVDLSGQTIIALHHIYTLVKIVIQFSPQACVTSLCCRDNTVFVPYTKGSRIFSQNQIVCINKILLQSKIAAGWKFAQNPATPKVTEATVRKLFVQTLGDMDCKLDYQNVQCKLMLIRYKWMIDTRLPDNTGPIDSYPGVIYVFISGASDADQ
jgi:hypothetical protein